jgi:hypothetical protein
MAENDRFDPVAYYRDLVNLFKGGPVFKQRIAAKVTAPGERTTPVGTARAFMKDTNNMYSNMMSSYGQYNRLARYSRIPRNGIRSNHCSCFRFIF